MTIWDIGWLTKSTTMSDRLECLGPCFVFLLYSLYRSLEIGFPMFFDSFEAANEFIQEHGISDSGVFHFPD